MQLEGLSVECGLGVHLLLHPGGDEGGPHDRSLPGITGYPRMLIYVQYFP